MVDETSEEKVEDTLEVEKAVNYICIKECFWNKVYKLGDDLTFKGDHPMLKLFKVKEEGGPVEEVLEDEGPKSFSEIAKHEAQETIDSINRGLDPETLESGQAPVDEAPAEVEVQTDEVPVEEVQTDEVPVEEVPVESASEEFLE